jgi:hypothetical protein
LLLLVIVFNLGSIIKDQNWVFNNAPHIKKNIPRSRNFERYAMPDQIDETGTSGTGQQKEQPQQCVDVEFK